MNTTAYNTKLQNILIKTIARLRVAPEGALRENILYNEEPGRGAGRLARRGAAPGGTTDTTQAEYHLVAHDTLVLELLINSFEIDNNQIKVLMSSKIVSSSKNT